MRFLFIRHGEPDYDNDCLTTTGKLQAQAAAKRLKDENISEIYSSPYGRAVETAEATAKELGLKVHVLDFMHEVTWGGNVPEDGHPWTLSDKMLYEDNFDFYHNDWRDHPYFKNNTILPCYDEIAKSIDEFLLTQGYRHEGNRYFCSQENQKTIALFSHGGSGGAALSHLLSLPYPYFLCVFPYTYTSVISLDFPSIPGHYIHTQMELFNDSAHIKGLNEELKLQQVKDKI